jgi:hypothetical protein
MGRQRSQAAVKSPPRRRHATLALLGRYVYGDFGPGRIWTCPVQARGDGGQPGARRRCPCHALNVRYGECMSDTLPKPEVARPTAPEMEMAGSCPVCEGDVAVRFTGRHANTVCRRCGYMTHSIVHQHAGQILFEQLVRAAA